MTSGTFAGTEHTQVSGYDQTPIFMPALDAESLGLQRVPPRRGTRDWRHMSLATPPLGERHRRLEPLPSREAPRPPPHPSAYGRASLAHVAKAQRIDRVREDGEPRAPHRHPLRTGVDREHSARDAPAAHGVPPVAAPARLLDEALGALEDGADDGEVLPPRARLRPHLSQPAAELLLDRQVLALHADGGVEGREDGAEGHAGAAADHPADDRLHRAALSRRLPRVGR
eukprot:CAMPEP_0205900830 /NCGR_PEP_ID=MMETSP1083-20121108/27350_1 /ASSEMBLY_ACC=CAM_ASM_000430 /TAXON_ID=97485 /ORGANISM="Prymnesium parvum, Strain Texoma1" /LENGTH=227 /DNA_ID=CAMNT_0053266303 /DNA_START=50 /DNA_END=731 /DNA_ORIENTATION=-